MIDVRCDDESLIKWVEELETLANNPIRDNMTYEEVCDLLLRMRDIEKHISLVGALGYSNISIGNGDLRERYRRRALHAVRYIINHVEYDEWFCQSTILSGIHGERLDQLLPV